MGRWARGSFASLSGQLLDLANRIKRAWGTPGRQAGKEEQMLWAIAVVFLVLWLLGLVTSYTMGGFIHVLLVIAVIVVILRVIQGRRVL